MQKEKEEEEEEGRRGGRLERSYRYERQIKII